MNISRNRLNIILALVLVVITCAAYFLLVDTNTLTLFPSKGLYIDTYHESLDSNYSKTQVDEKSDGLHFKYTLSKDTALIEPFAATFMKPADTTAPFFQLAGYSHVRIKLKSTKAQRISFQITQNYPEFTDTTEFLGNMPFLHLLTYDKNTEVYEIPISDMKTPSWWFRRHKIEEKYFPNTDFNRSNYVVIGNCPLIEPGIEDEIIISEISFYNKNTSAYTLLLIIFGSGLLIIVVINLLRTKKKILVPYQAIELNEEPDNHLQKIVAYIAREYTNPELNLDDTAMEAGISTKEVSRLIKEKYQASFKEYLNSVRLTEVKRLLKESKLPVSDIAYKAGYNNISHFNRVFKTYEAVSPKKYRESNDA